MGYLQWHPSASRFCGAGISSRNVPFSYSADWSSAGRWGIQVCTAKAKYILSPMEKLQSIQLGSVNLKSEPLSEQFDLQYKPGLYKQVQAFLFDTPESLCSLDYQIEAFKYYCQIGGYLLND